MIFFFSPHPSPLIAALRGQRPSRAAVPFCPFIPLPLSAEDMQLFLPLCASVCLRSCFKKKKPPCGSWLEVVVEVTSVAL